MGITCWSSQSTEGRECRVGCARDLKICGGYRTSTCFKTCNLPHSPPKGGTRGGIAQTTFPDAVCRKGGRRSVTSLTGSCALLISGFSKDEPSLFRRRAVELKHGRVRETGEGATDEQQCRYVDREDRRRESPSFSCCRDPLAPQVVVCTSIEQVAVVDASRPFLVLPPFRLPVQRPKQN